MAFVEMRSVVKRFGDHVVLDGVDLQVEKGEVIAIIGRSGSGKSTLLRCLNGLEAVQSGDVIVDGVRVKIPFRTFAPFALESASSFRATTCFRTSLSSGI